MLLNIKTVLNKLLDNILNQLVRLENGLYSENLKKKKAYKYHRVEINKLLKKIKITNRCFIKNQKKRFNYINRRIVNNTIIIEDI